MATNFVVPTRENLLAAIIYYWEMLSMIPERQYL